MFTFEILIHYVLEVLDLLNSFLTSKGFKRHFRVSGSFLDESSVDVSKLSFTDNIVHNLYIRFFYSRNRCLHVAGHWGITSNLGKRGKTFKL